MNILSVENITKGYTEKALLDNTNFYLQDGEKVGVIGVNGTGKSTLLKIIAGKMNADSGTVTKANNIVISYLSQNPDFEKDEKVIESAVKNNISEFDNEWEIISSAKSMLNKLGIENFEQKTSELSGGQRKKIALVNALISKAEILILDEPTNHLDAKMSNWLEQELKNRKSALIMVTHDRYFLDSVTNRIVEIDNGKIYNYNSNYSGFLELKNEREDMLIASDRKRKSILKKELEWMRRGARARSTKAKSRIERFETMKNTEDFQKASNVEMESVYSRLGKTTIELENISKSYGKKVLIKDFSYIFLKTDRVAFIGENGCGKTTLMKIITKRLSADSGELTIGQTVKIGYYTQEIENQNNKKSVEYMEPTMNVIDYIRETAEYVKTKSGMITASQMLEKFLFDSEKQYTRIENLSGGEKRRLNLLRVLMEAPNVLVLDEPTNDLDIATLTILEDYLDSFEGIVIAVSHDRYFLDRVINRIFAFEGNGGILQYEGGYTEYSINKKQEDKVKKEKIMKVQKNEKPKVKKLKFTYKEEKEYEVIEEVVSNLEIKIENLETEIVKNATDYSKLRDLTEEKEKLEKELEEKLERWEYLEELNSKIQEQSK